MIHYPHPHNEHHHNENIKEWWATETNRYLQDRLRNLVVRANWNKRIICKIHLSPNDLEMHRYRFADYLNDLESIAKQLKSIGMQYNHQRMITIKQSLTKIMNYENKKTTRGS